VRCGYILHPSFGLVLGLVLRERIRCKGKGVKITNLNLDIPYNLLAFFLKACFGFFQKVLSKFCL
jgi:hypothetical protein